MPRGKPKTFNLAEMQFMIDSRRAGMTIVEIHKELEKQRGETFDIKRLYSFIGAQNRLGMGIHRPKKQYKIPDTYLSAKEQSLMQKYTKVGVCRACIARILGKKPGTMYVYLKERGL